MSLWSIATLTFDADMFSLGATLSIETDRQTDSQVQAVDDACKKLANLKAACALHVAYYNFCRVHQTLRVTPAMEAELTDHGVWKSWWDYWTRGHRRG
jgi:hypothetical protein